MEDKKLFNERKEKIFNFIKDNQDKPITKKDLIYILEIPKEDYDAFVDVVDSLEEDGKIIQTTRGKLMLPENLNMLTGTFSATDRGFGFVVFEDDREDIFIAPNNVNGAAHKDIVLCQITHKKSNKKVEGEIIRVLKKGINTVVGTFTENRNYGFVIPDNKKIKDIFITKKNTKNAVNGHKVVVEITKPSTDENNAEGVVTEILGHKNDVGVDILSIIKELEIPTVFPDEVMLEAENVPLEVSKEEMVGREDVRDEFIVTIDGDDTKDIDDGFSLIKLENGNYQLAVYIADVTHYVKEGSPLDVEALDRGTSVYLADRVIPMLPHALSNGICSLNEGVDRLSLACRMEINNKGEVVTHKIFNALIKVNKRMTYTIVNDLLTNPSSEYLEKYKEDLEFYNNARDLAKILNRRRMKNGSIDFNFPESKLIVDETGKVVDIKAFERNVATNIIEEFMLITNSTVAEDFFWQEAPFVYRNHEAPDEEKLEKVKKFISGLGFSLKGQSTHPRAIQNLLESVADTPYEFIISRYVLRSMQQARYSSSSIGHYGLSIRYYSHFTSPIRRYPDLQIHRIIKESLAGRLIDNNLNHFFDILPEVCTQSSFKERRAEEAERETNKYKKVEFMEDKINEVYEGVISSVTSWGIYVELPNTIEGMVAIGTMDDDHYFFDEVNMAYRGTRRIYALGQEVYVEVVKADKVNRRLDFAFVEGDFDESEDGE
ncbi:MAG: ribonuclease R [Lachnospirales bacterium]